MVRLWMHEMARVFGDRLADPPQRVTLEHMLMEAVGRSVPMFRYVVVLTRPTIKYTVTHCTSFVSTPRFLLYALLLRRITVFIVMKDLESGILFIQHLQI